MPGRKKKPLALVRMHGTHKKAVKDTEEVTAPLGIPSAPDWLHQGALEEWGRVTKLLSGMGLMTHADLQAVACYCQACYEFGELAKKEDKDAWEVVSQHRLYKIVQSLCAEYGLTASSRARMSIPGKKAPSKMGALLSVV